MDEREPILIRLPPKTKRDLEKVARASKRSTCKEAELAIENHIAAADAPHAGVEAD